MKISSFVFILFISYVPYSQADRFYVSATAAEGGDGLSWGTAFRYLQDALDDTAVDREDEVWIAAGTYYPDEGASVTDGDRTATFRLKRTTTLYGGFAGTETSTAERNISANETILSGEINADPALWSLHVCKITNANIDGVTITRGNANGLESPDNEGGAIDAGGTNEARNCKFVENSAAFGGVAFGGTWTVIDCIFTDNTATIEGGVAKSGNWTVSGSIFTGNEAATQGGVANGGTWIVTDSTFSSNTSPLGGVSVGGNWTVTDTTFSANTSAIGGVLSGGNWTIDSSEFNENTATEEGGVANLGIVTVTDSTFYKNSAPLGGVAARGTWNIKRSQFLENAASTDGGVATAGNWTVFNSLFRGNAATGRGGVGNTSNWTVANSVFVENTAGDRGGVARGGTWTVTTSTFLNNTGGVTGGVARGGTWLATNNIFQGSGNNLLPLLFTNSAEYSETPAPDKERAYNLIDVEWTDGDIGEGFILSGDPLFADVNDPDGPDDIWGNLDDGLRLDTGSAAIAFGDPAFLPADIQDIDEDADVAELLPLDAAGVTRIQNGTLDLGAYEYVEPPYTLITNVSPGASGSVTDSGNGGYEENELAIIEATPAEGFVFDSWEGDASGSANPLELLIDANKVVTAIFLAQYPLTVTVNPENSGAVEESGDGNYTSGSSATVEAIPAAGYVFHEWTGDLSGTTNPTNVLMDNSKSVTAVFKKQVSLTTAVNPSGTGTISDSGNGSYLEGDTATVQATPAAGYQFVRWQGDATGSENPLEITMDEDKSLVAVFTETITPIYSLTKVASPTDAGSISDDGDGQYLEGSTAMIEAFPAFSYLFDRWEGAASGSDNPVAVVMDEDKEITAVFIQNVLPVVNLTKVVNPTEAGTISDSGEGQYLQGDTATLQALPEPGFLFERWEGAATGS